MSVLRCLSYEGVQLRDWMRDGMRSRGDSVTASNNLISYLRTNLTILLPVFPVYSFKLALDTVMLLNKYA